MQHFNSHVVVRPPNRLKDRAVTIGEDDEQIDAETIARADAALADLRPQFAEWMASSVARLATCYSRYLDTDPIGLDIVGDPPHTAFYRAAHDIKGTAALYGYPVVARIAGSLALLLERPVEDGRVMALLDSHMMAIRRLHTEGPEAASRPVASDIADALLAVVKVIVAPKPQGELPAVKSPPLQAG